MRNSSHCTYRVVSGSNTTQQFHSSALLPSPLLAGPVPVPLLLGMAPVSQLLVDLVLWWGMVGSQPCLEIISAPMRSVERVEFRRRLTDGEIARLRLEAGEVMRFEIMGE